MQYAGSAGVCLGRDCPLGLQNHFGWVFLEEEGAQGMMAQMEEEGVMVEEGTGAVAAVTMSTMDALGDFGCGTCFASSI